MYKLYLIYNEYRSGGEVCEGQENDSWPNYEDTNIEFSPIGLVTDREKAGVYAHGISDSEIFGEIKTGCEALLVVNRYSDGDTFSHTNGYWEIVGVFADFEEAIRAEKSVETNGTWNGNKTYDGGYFGSRESVDIHPIVVNVERK